MKLLRTLPTARLLALLAVVVAVAVGATIAVAATRGGGPTPPPEPLATAVRDALTAPKPSGITARVHFTNGLLGGAASALAGRAGSALLSGATGRLWANGHGGRVELQSDAGDTQITWNDSKLTVYDASSNTAYVADLPARKAGAAQTATVPPLSSIATVLQRLGAHWTLSGATPTSLAGQPAYTVTASPKGRDGLLGSVALAWGALHGTPLDLAVYARGASSPALALRVTQISFGSVPDSDIDVSPPAGATIVDLSAHRGGGTSPAPVTGLAAVQAAAPFPVTAPDTLDGLPRQDVRLVGPADGRVVVVVYGQGLGALLLVERQAGAGAMPGPLAQLPTVSIGGTAAHELPTPLGTILAWERGGVSYLLAGSVPAGVAEAAARSLP